VKVVQAYRYALDPTPAQAAALASHCGGARFAFNWGLGQVKANLAQREAEKTYGIPEERLTPLLSWSMYSLRKRWNAAKSDVVPWWADNSKEAYACGLDRLAAALKNWDASRKSKRAGARVGFPRFKAKHRIVPSCRFTTGAIRVESDRRHVTLPRLGTIRTSESTRKLARHLERGTGRIMAATIRYKGGRWLVSFTCEIERAEGVPARPDAVVGVDLGVKDLAVLSTGELVPNRRHHAAALRELRRLGKELARRQGPRTPTGDRREASARWHKTKAALGRAHAKVANQRRDGVHKLTSRLAADYGTVVVEDLNVSGMLANRRLARAVADAGMSEVRRQLAYKTTWNGGRLIVADRWFPSSKTCSGCGAVKTKLALSERTYTCTTCGLLLNRDENAARNLAALAVDVAQSCGETENAPRETGRDGIGRSGGAGVRPASGGPSALKREPRKRGTPGRKATAA
jgi:putative transposase